ncbi:MAG: DsbA family oxidoreductase [Rhodospirillaceae bacterium]
MKIDIIADTICPWCYIGKKRLDRALEIRPQPDLLVGWRAFQLNPEIPPGGVDRRLYIAQKFGGTDRARSVHDTLARTGTEVGISFDFSAIESTPNTMDSHRLVRFAAEHGMQTPVIDALFAAYLVHGRDIGDRAELAAIAGECGLDRTAVTEYLDSDRDVETILAEDDLARRLGVNGVPCFIVDRKYAVSGAQSPEVLVQVFDLANQEAEQFAAE